MIMWSEQTSSSCQHQGTMSKTGEAVFTETYRQLCGHDPDQGFPRMEQVTIKTSLTGIHYPWVSSGRYTNKEDTGVASKIWDTNFFLRAGRSTVALNLH